MGEIKHEFSGNVVTDEKGSFQRIDLDNMKEVSDSIEKLKTPSPPGEDDQGADDEVKGKGLLVSDNINASDVHNEKDNPGDKFPGGKRRTRGRKSSRRKQKGSSRRNRRKSNKRKRRNKK